MTVIDQSNAQRNNRSCSSSSSSNGANMNNCPNITLEIPSNNYLYFLSPIHEVPTPLPSPSHTPVPSLRRQNAASDSDGSPCKRFQPTSTKHGATRSKPLLTPSITICDDQGRFTEVTAGDQPAISKQPSTEPLQSPAAASQPPPKPKPPPIIITDSNFSRFENVDADIPEIQIFCYSAEPSAEIGQVFESHSVASNWHKISIGSPPVKKNPATCLPSSFDATTPCRYPLKNSVDKSNSLDLPTEPPMITITSNLSEVESDTDIGILSGIAEICKGR